MDIYVCNPTGGPGPFSLSPSATQDLSLADIEKEYWDAMKDFPIQGEQYIPVLFTKRELLLRENAAMFRLPLYKYVEGEREVTSKP